MGCSHDKCWGNCPKSSNADCSEFREVGTCGVQRKHVLSERSTKTVPVPSCNFRLDYSVLTQRGNCPDLPVKENHVGGNPNVHFFSVCDRHGLFGTRRSKLLKDRLVEKLGNDLMLVDDPAFACHAAFQATSQELHNSEIDDLMSGTTAITVLIVGDKLFVANAGDLWAVIFGKVGNCVLAEDLSSELTPFWRDEYERVKLCGARVMSVDQVEGLKDPNIQTWGDEETQGNDPPQFWVLVGMYPGTAFTSSTGDSTAQKLGMVAYPEVSVVRLLPDHSLSSSDDVFEFLSSQAVVNMVARYSDSSRCMHCHSWQIVQIMVGA